MYSNRVPVHDHRKDGNRVLLHCHFFLYNLFPPHYISAALSSRIDNYSKRTKVCGFLFSKCKVSCKWGKPENRVENLREDTWVDTSVCVLTRVNLLNYIITGSCISTWQHTFKFYMDLPFTRPRESLDSPRSSVKRKMNQLNVFF